MRKWMSFAPEDHVFEAVVYELFERINAFAGANRLPRPITNAVLDFRELLALGRGAGGMPHSYADGDYRGGWVAPNLWHVGCVARESAPATDCKGYPCQVGRFFRGFTLLSLDAPTVSFGITMPVGQTFWAHVIDPLVTKPAPSSPEEWLSIFFRFCRSKPVAILSAGPPGPWLRLAATSRRVRLVHVPLVHVASEILAAQHSFHLLRLTENQWEALLSMVGDGREAVRG